ncbi:MAG: Fe-S protein assembly co-chaperone HscB [Bacteroidetes bacterium]|nr:Fe-S protein assembly co-chaperone HscB [Bacteroidota bacterium]
MDTGNYFRFYGLEPTFNLDEKLLRQKYLEINKTYHPDFFVLDPAKQAEALQISSYNNDAYKTLEKFDKRVAYYLSLYGLYDKESKAELPPDFLMDVIDLNEELADAQFDADETKISILKSKINALMQEPINNLKRIGLELDKTQNKEVLHNEAKTEFQKYKYFSRLLSKIE